MLTMFINREGAYGPLPEHLVCMILSEGIGTFRFCSECVKINEMFSEDCVLLNTPCINCYYTWKLVNQRGGLFRE